MLSYHQKTGFGVLIIWCDIKPYIDSPLKCCPGLNVAEYCSSWPPWFKDEKQREQTLDLQLKFIEEKIKVSSIHYKISKRT